MSEFYQASDYHIIRNVHMFDFVTTVKRFLDEGWLLLGAPFGFNGDFCQAMIKMPPECVTALALEKYDRHRGRTR